VELVAARRLHDISALRPGRVLVIEHDAVLALGAGVDEACGEEEITRTSIALWARERVHLATPRRVLQAGDTALSLGGGISVMRRGTDRRWRYAICAPAIQEKEER
jgi:hypothetical protein